jgi:hypothetical protein
VPSHRDMHVYRVGSPYHPDRRLWPEGPQYGFHAGSHELLLFFDRPTEREVGSVGSGSARFALAVHGPVIFLLFRFEPAMPWSDAPYSIHLVPEEERQAPEPVATPEPHALLQVTLVDARTGIIRALRALTFGPALTTALHLAIRDQLAAPWNRAAYDRAVDLAYRRYPTTERLLETALVRDDSHAR